jgi:hypothetical protein
MKVRLTVPVATRPAPIRAHGTPPRLTRPAVARPAVIPAALLRIGRAAAGAALLAVAVAACSGGGSASSVPSIFTPSPHVTTSTASGGAGRTPSPSSGSTGKSSATDKPTSSATATSTVTATPPATATPTHRPTATPSATAKATPRPTPTVTHHATTTPTRYYPVGAPATGGGGTAGLQDVTLFGAGGAAILAGFASLAYRRRLARKRRADTRPAAPTHTTVH